MNKVLAKKRPKIWVLTDHRMGNAHQALALADKLSDEYQVKHIKYNLLVYLPNYFLSFFPVHINKHLLQELIAEITEEIPDIIISAGRRTASLAAYLKKFSLAETRASRSRTKKIKVIQIMRPNTNPLWFDLIILPQHDNYKYSLPNVVRIIGALNNVRSTMPETRAAFRLNYPNIKDFIAVIIGGSSKKYNFTNADAKLLIQSLSIISENHSLPLFVTFSRRTPTHVKTKFKQVFSEPHIIYDFEENVPNPYPAIIGEAQYIIITADSISMCSEAASTGTPIYIFCPPYFTLKKHKFFIQQLVDLGIVKRLLPDTAFLPKYEYEPLYEIDKVVDIIKKRKLI